MSNKTYDIIKVIGLIILPALTTFVGITLEAVNYEHTVAVVTIMTAFDVMLGTIIEKLSAMYKKNNN